MRMCPGIIASQVVRFDHRSVQMAPDAACPETSDRSAVLVVVAWKPLNKELRIRKILVSVKCLSAILGPEMAAPILWTPGKNVSVLQEKPCP